MRLLSFLSDIEQALLAESAAGVPSTWKATRMVSYHHGLARLSLEARPGQSAPGGTIFLQLFVLADDTHCAKATLHWDGTESFQSFSIYSTPGLDWRREAARLAEAWQQGPHEWVTSAAKGSELRPLAATA